MGKAFSIEPKDVKRVATPFRQIVTKIPAPETLEVLETLHRCEPISMTGQPPIVWDRAEGVQVYDCAGNKWLDWSSGVVVANAGHGASEVREAIRRQVDKGLLHNYCFPNAERAGLVQYLVDITPKDLNKVFLLTTGSEATECAMKLARTYGQRVGGREKVALISFGGAFHGRTLGAQMAGGIPAFYINRLSLRDERGRELLRLNAFEPVSENPVFSFDFAGEPRGRLQLVGGDNNGNRISGTVE